MPLFLARVFHLEELNKPNRGHGNGLSSCRLGCHLDSSSRAWHEVWQLWEQVWQGVPTPVAGTLPQEHHA